MENIPVTDKKQSNIPDPQPVPSTPLPKPNKGQKILFILITILAIELIAGLAYGLVFYKSLQVAKETEAQPSVLPLFLTIASPKDVTGVVNDEILVTGSTLPNTIVAIYTDNDDVTVESGADGTFESTVLVGEAGGLVRISAFAESGEEKTKTLWVGEELTDMEVLGKTTAPGQMKKNETTGTVSTEPTEGTKKTNNKPVRIVSPSPKETGKKQEKLGTAALKELLSAESTASAGLGSLKRYQIREASAGAALKRHAVMGVITETGEGTITIAHQTQRDRLTIILFNAQTVFSGKDDAATGSGQLSVGIRITAVGIPSDDGLLATRIHIVPGKATGIFNRLPVATKSAEFTTGTPSATASPTATLTPTETATPTATIPPASTNTPTP